MSQTVLKSVRPEKPLTPESLKGDLVQPGHSLCLEHWESDPKYRDRKAVKQALYAKHGFQLIELGDAEIERLDDVLPRMLLRFGIESA